MFIRLTPYCSHARSFTTCFFFSVDLSGPASAAGVHSFGAATQTEALVKGMTKNRLNLNDARPFGKIEREAARRQKTLPSPTRCAAKPA